MQHGPHSELVPQQRTGSQKDISHTYTAANVDEAKDCFVTAKDRLLNVNNWQEICDGLSSGFILTDRLGNEVDRPAQQGDLIKIDIPGPGSASGEGYDWVYIENMQYQTFPDEDREFLGFTVRPVHNPKNHDDDDISHFYIKDATSTFITERKGRQLYAVYYGRNEAPNTGTDNLIDKARNAVVGTMGIAGLSDAQWLSLMKGLIDFGDD